MDRIERLNSMKWVEDRLATLHPPDGWKPDIHAGLAKLNRGRVSRQSRPNGWIYVGASLMVLSSVLAFPGTRVLAQRCVDACVAQTDTVRGFLSKRLHLVDSLTEPVMQIGMRRMAPDFRLADASGRFAGPADFRGRVVLLNFWATWCRPCKVEIPWFKEFAAKYRDRGLVVLGVAMDDDGWRSVKPYIKQGNIDYRVMIGDESLAQQYGGLEALPTTFLIDRAGRVAAIHTGLVDKRAYDQELQSLLSER